MGEWGGGTRGEGVLGVMGSQMDSTDVKALGCQR